MCRVVVDQKNNHGNCATIIYTTRWVITQCTLYVATIIYTTRWVITQCTLIEWLPGEHSNICIIHTPVEWCCKWGYQGNCVPSMHLQVGVKGYRKVEAHALCFFHWSIYSHVTKSTSKHPHLGHPKPSPLQKEQTNLGKEPRFSWHMVPASSLPQCMAHPCTHPTGGRIFGTPDLSDENWIGGKPQNHASAHWHVSVEILLTVSHTENVIMIAWCIVYQFKVFKDVFSKQENASKWSLFLNQIVLVRITWQVCSLISKVSFGVLETKD